MKNLLIAVLCGLALASCNKDETQTPRPLRQFDYAMQGNSMYTKTIESDAVLSAISDNLPQSVSLVLSGTKNYVVKTGEATDIPSGTYNVSGTYFGDVMGKIVSADNSFLSKGVAIKVSQSGLEITDEETNYTLPATYYCFALVCDATQVESATAIDAYGDAFDVDFIQVGDVMIVFGTGLFEKTYLKITLHPKDTESFSDTEYTLSTKQLNNVGLVEHGKWYLLEPTYGGEQPKLLSYDLPSMEQGFL